MIMTTEEKKKQLVNEKNYDFNSLRMLTEVLRGKGGCPWDMEQTHESIRNDIIEETYEVVEAIDNSDPKLLREELGDELLDEVNGGMAKYRLYLHEPFLKTTSAASQKIKIIKG